MEGYQGHNSNTPYALFYLRYMDVNHALSQSDMLHTSLKIVFWIIPFGYCVPPIKLKKHNIEYISVLQKFAFYRMSFRILVYFYRFSRTCVLSIWLTVNGYTVMTYAKPLNRFPLYSILLKSIMTTQLNF